VKKNYLLQNNLSRRDAIKLIGISPIAASVLASSSSSSLLQASENVEGKIVIVGGGATMKGKTPSAVFDGYTVCPLKTRYGSIIMAEFNYKGPSPTTPLAFEEPRWIWWAFDLYILKLMYQHLMLTGRF